jgi:hypothetical protein
MGLVLLAAQYLVGFRKDQYLEPLLFVLCMPVKHTLIPRHLILINSEKQTISFYVFFIYESQFQCFADKLAHSNHQLP